MSDKDHPQSTPDHAEPLPQGDVKADHSMNEEQKLGWDQAPKGQNTPDPHRHPRQAGQGGTPEEGLDPQKDTPLGDTSSDHLRKD